MRRNISIISIRIVNIVPSKIRTKKKKKKTFASMTCNNYFIGCRPCVGGGREDDPRRNAQIFGSPTCVCVFFSCFFFFLSASAELYIIIVYRHALYYITIIYIYISYAYYIIIDVMLSSSNDDTLIGRGLESVVVSVTIL